MVGHEGKPIGPAQVLGLEAALEETSRFHRGELGNVPDIEIVADDSAVEHWCQNWPLGGERRDIVVRDNRRKRWLMIENCWIRKATGSQFTLVTERVAEVDRPLP